MTHNLTEKLKMMVPVVLFSFLGACSSAQQEAEEQEDLRVKTVELVGKDFVYADATRTLVDVNGTTAQIRWAQGDVLGVFPETGNQVEFPLETGSDSYSAIFTGGAWALRNDTRYSCYYPFNKWNYFRDGKTIILDYTGQKQLADGDLSHIGAYDFMGTDNPMIPINGKLVFNLQHVGALVEFKITAPTKNTWMGMVFHTDQNVIPVMEEMDVLGSQLKVTPTQEDCRLLLLLNNFKTTAGQELTLYMMLPAMNLLGSTATVRLVDLEGSVYEGNLAQKNLEQGKFYQYSSSNLVPVEYEEEVKSPAYSTQNW